MELNTEITLLLHESGTKFYEVSKFYNHAGGRFVVVNRWGKRSEIRGGGKSKVEARHGEWDANEVARKKLAEKMKRGYEISSATGFNSMPKQFDADLARLKLNEHFGDEDTVASIMHHLELSDVVTASTADLDHLFGSDNIVVEEPEPEIVRGNDWASW